MLTEYGHAQRAHRGATAYLAGRMAEESVAERYARDGYRLIESRWRAVSGEIDLIFERAGTIVFAEVKKGASHEMAAARLSRKQMDRICLAACEFMARRYPAGVAPMRFDAALVDDLGAIDIIENAFGEN